MNRRAFFAGLALAPLAALGFEKKAAATNTTLKVEMEPITISLQGEAFSRQSVEELLNAINEATADGHRMIAGAV